MIFQRIDRIMDAITNPVHSVSTNGKGEGFSFEADTVNEARWSELVAGFDDANLYQTWPYGVVRSGPSNLSHLLVKHGSEVVALAQARIARIPGLPLGAAYVLSGPLWKRRHRPVDAEIFRQVVRAVRMEYAGRRKLVARLVPNLNDSDDPVFQRILGEEGYVLRKQAPCRRTILMDLGPSLDELQRGFHQKWRYHLNKARKQPLEIVQGVEDHLFEAFRQIFGEMVDRKQLVNFTGPDHCRQAQANWNANEQVRVFLCKVEGEVCAGGICSALGDTGIYLFGATSNRGIKTYASYLVHWRMLEWVKARGCRKYDLNGINPEKNPGGYQFKSQLAGGNGREVQLLGPFDAYPNPVMRWFAPIGDRLLAGFKHGRATLARFGR